MQKAVGRFICLKNISETVFQSTIVTYAEAHFQCLATNDLSTLLAFAGPTAEQAIVEAYAIEVARAEFEDAGFSSELLDQYSFAAVEAYDLEALRSRLCQLLNVWWDNIVGVVISGITFPISRDYIGAAYGAVANAVRRGTDVSLDDAYDRTVIIPNAQIIAMADQYQDAVDALRATWDDKFSQIEFATIKQQLKDITIG